MKFFRKTVKNYSNSFWNNLFKVSFSLSQSHSLSLSLLFSLSTYLSLSLSHFLSLCLSLSLSVSLCLSLFIYPLPLSLSLSISEKRVKLAIFFDKLVPTSLNLILAPPVLTLFRLLFEKHFSLSIPIFWNSKRNNMLQY